MHVDTGHNYPEVTAFRDKRAAELGERLIVRSVEDSMTARHGRAEVAEGESRNKHQSVTLLEAIEEFGFDACIGGARRDEEKARAKERIFSFRDEFGQWDPKNQRPELWSLYNARIHKGENIRAFPISNWTELDVWQYIEREGLELPSIYFAHTRPVVRRKGAWCRSTCR
jgi:sulfate adenylyltransferase subunit 2